MTVIILAKWDRDPRQHRVVLKDGEIAAFEVCELDALGAASWRTTVNREDARGSHPGAKFTRESIVARALFVMTSKTSPRATSEGGVLTIDIGTVFPGGTVRT